MLAFRQNSCNVNNQGGIAKGNKNIWNALALIMFLQGRFDGSASGDCTRFASVPGLEAALHAMMEKTVSLLTFKHKNCVQLWGSKGQAAMISWTQKNLLCRAAMASLRHLPRSLL